MGKTWKAWRFFLVSKRSQFAFRKSKKGIGFLFLDIQNRRMDARRTKRYEDSYGIKRVCLSNFAAVHSLGIASDCLAQTFVRTSTNNDISPAENLSCRRRPDRRSDVSERQSRSCSGEPTKLINLFPGEFVSPVLPHICEV